MTLIDCAGAQQNSVLAAMEPSGQASLVQHFTPYQVPLVSAGLLYKQRSSTIHLFRPRVNSQVITSAVIKLLKDERPTADPTHNATFTEVDSPACTMKVLDLHE